jgi:hypothetical protein
MILKNIRRYIDYGVGKNYVLFKSKTDDNILKRSPLTIIDQVKC